LCEILKQLSLSKIEFIFIFWVELLTSEN
jgi:hypothetical protein